MCLCHGPIPTSLLPQAASFGKCFLDKFPPESFVRMCQDLRVLNAVRDYQIGIPLTFTQYPPWARARRHAGGCRIRGAVQGRCAGVLQEEGAACAWWWFEVKDSP